MTRQDNIIIWCLGVLNMTKTLFGHDKYVAVLFIAFISLHKDPFHLLILLIIIER